MASNLLVTKLYTPPERKNLVPRLRLIHMLNKAWQQDKKLTLVSASAGYGKTTLVTRAYHLRVHSDIPSAIDYARRALYILPQTDALSRGLAALTLGLAYWNTGDFQESERAFLEVDRMCSPRSFRSMTRTNRSLPAYPPPAG